MSISRTRNAQHKVYIPASVRENQYLLAKFEITDALLNTFADTIDKNSDKPYQAFYQKLAALFFKINNVLELESSLFVANDKFTRIRYSPEKITSQTDQQILFLYNSLYHTVQGEHFDGAKLAKKINLVFLANGEEVRLNSAKFHHKVKQALAQFVEQTKLEPKDVRVCDHQHLTYDLYAKQKGVSGTQTHKLRSMTTRYQADDIALPENTDSLTYAIIDIPVNKRIQQLAEVDKSSPEPYHALYNLVADAFTSAAKKQHLNNGAVIANGLIPIVRRSDDGIVVANGELQMLGYNPKKSSGGYTCKWDAAELVDYIQLVFVANDQNRTSHGYGKFLNHVESALHSMAEKLGYVTDKEEMLVRLHQHIGYYLAE